MNKNSDFTKGPILGPLIKFMIPVLAALFLQSLYGAVDLVVVGQFATSADVSGVSTGSQMMSTLTNLVANFATSTTILLGQRIGQGRRRECGQIIGSSIVFFAAIGVALTVFTVVFAPFLANLFACTGGGILCDGFVPSHLRMRYCGHHCL